MLISRIVPVLLSTTLLYQATKSSDGIFKKTVDAVKAVVTTNELRSIKGMLIRDYVRSVPFPRTEKEIYVWFQKNFETSKEDEEVKNKDPYGSLYIFRKKPRGFEVRSAGPDTIPDTKDDIIESYHM